MRVIAAPLLPPPRAHALHAYFDACPESPDGRFGDRRRSIILLVLSPNRRRVYFNADLGPWRVGHLAELPEEAAP